MRRQWGRPSCRSVFHRDNTPGDIFSEEGRSGHLLCVGVEHGGQEVERERCQEQKRQNTVSKDTLSSITPYLLRLSCLPMPTPRFHQQICPRVRSDRLDMVATVTKHPHGRLGDTSGLSHNSTKHVLLLDPHLW